VQEAVTEPPKRGRPPKQEATVSKMETVEVRHEKDFAVYSDKGGDYIKMLQAEMSNRKPGELIAALKSLSIRKLNTSDLTPDEAKSVLLWLEQNAEKGE
jgi:hypothetical protein